MNNNEYKILNTVNQWIFNCDTKTSIILAIYGVLLPIIFSLNIGKSIANIIKLSLKNRTISNVTYLCFLVLAIILFIIGLYKLIHVLMPTINLKHKSIMFFGNVASYETFDQYVEEVKNYTQDDINEDLLHQIFAASKICNQKFKYFKEGLILSLISLSMIFIWLFIGYITYYL